MTYKTFVLKYKGQYAKFASYSSFKLVDNPLMATLYSKRGLAARKRDVFCGHYYHKTEMISAKLLEVRELSLELLSES
jgi:hypothetical protein